MGWPVYCGEIVSLATKLGFYWGDIWILKQSWNLKLRILIDYIIILRKVYEQARKKKYKKHLKKKIKTAQNDSLPNVTSFLTFLEKGRKQKDPKKFYSHFLLAKTLTKISSGVLNCKALLIFPFFLNLFIEVTAIFQVSE